MFVISVKGTISVQGKFKNAGINLYWNSLYNGGNFNRTLFPLVSWFQQI